MLPFPARVATRLALLALAAAAPGCATTTCTAIGCEDSLTFTFDETVARDYVVTVVVNGQTGTADCTAAVDANTANALLLELQGELGGYVECGPTSLRLLSAPTKAAVTITFPDGTKTDASATPAYEESTPNGEDCEPVCRQAGFDIDIHPPSGA
jgi:hypothetical protein